MMPRACCGGVLSEGWRVLYQLCHCVKAVMVSAQGAGYGRALVPTRPPVFRSYSKRALSADKTDRQLLSLGIAAVAWGGLEEATEGSRGPEGVTFHGPEGHAFPGTVLA
jgi:hypothetical protein